MHSSYLHGALNAQMLSTRDPFSANVMLDWKLIGNLTLQLTS